MRAWESYQEPTYPGLIKEGTEKKRKCNNRDIVQDKQEEHKSSVRLLKDSNSEQNPSGNCTEARHENHVH